MICVEQSAKDNSQTFKLNHQTCAKSHKKTLQLECPTNLGQGPQSHYPRQYLGRFLKVDPPICDSAADRDIPLGFMLQRAEETEVVETNRIHMLLMHGMTSTRPSSIHFSPGEGKSGLSFLTWLPTPTFQICCTHKKNFCRQPGCFSIFPFWTLMSPHPSLCAVQRRQDGFFPPHMPAQMQAFIAHSILKPVLCSLGFHVWG